MKTLVAKTVIPHPELVDPVIGSGEVRFQAVIEGFACTVRIPCHEGKEMYYWLKLCRKTREGSVMEDWT